MCLKQTGCGGFKELFLDRNYIKDRIMSFTCRPDSATMDIADSYWR